MIVKDVRLARTGDVTVLSARCKIRKLGWDTVYYSVENAAQSADVYNDASPFATSLLLPSMKQGEDLIIRGSISQQLYKGMHAVMQEVLDWNLGFKPIEIKVDEVAADTNTPHRTAVFFSGGVDSFYTYLKHKDDPVEADRVDTFILVNGFDIDLRNKRLWNRTLQNITDIAAAEKVEVVVVESNIYGLLEPIMNWDYSHGGCLAAVGLFLRGAFHQVYMPGSYSAEEQAIRTPLGTSLAIDGHWSTESTTFVHDGTEASRLDKVIWQIAQSPLALEHLRVCHENEDKAYNCGKCEKCLRTMTSLYLAGALEKSSTFPHRIDPKLFAAVPTTAIKTGDHFQHEHLRILKERNLAPDLQEAIAVGLNNAAALKSSLAADIMARISYLDHIYACGYARSVSARLFGRRYS